MEAIPFTLPGSHEKSINVVEYSGASFYTHLHRHKEFQLMLIIKGEGTLVVDHNIYSFKDGDLFLIGPNQPHVFKSNREYFFKDSTKTIKGYAVFFNPEGYLNSIFRLPELTQEYSFLMENKGGLKIPENSVDSLSQEINSIRRTRGAERFAHFFSLIRGLFTLKGDPTPLSSNKTTNEFSDKKANRIQIIYDYILKNSHNDISLDDVAEQANFTTPAFCRYFKKHTGKTFVTFLNELRINEACKDLVSEKEGLQISQIAYKCGFSSITNFNRVFKAVIGKSPSVYQKEYFKKLSSTN